MVRKENEHSYTTNCSSAFYQFIRDKFAFAKTYTRVVKTLFQHSNYPSQHSQEVLLEAEKEM
jgi:hypothetical protein